MIVLPKYKDLYNDKPISFAVGIKGEVKCVLMDEMGRVVYESDWADNTIYDAGLDIIGTSAPFTVASIGDNASATVEAGPNQLGNRLDTSDSNDDDAGYGYAGATPWWFNRTVRLRFQNPPTMTVREMGMHVNAQPDNLYSRHLVTPEIPIVVGQALDIYYKHTYFPPLGDVILDDVLIDGILYDTLLRGCNYDRTVDGENGAFTKMGGFIGTGGSTYRRHFDGNIGATIEDFPSGASTTSYGFPLSDLAYTPSNHYIDSFIPLRLQDGNLATGSLLRTTVFSFNGGPFQIQWDSQASPGNGIPKDATKTMNITFRQSWVRHP